MEPVAKQTETSGAGYLCFQALGDEGEEWAGLLVVSPSGLPVEFLYSGPLRPTPVQAILYQDRLAREMRLSLVRSLRKGLRSRLLFVAVAPDELDPDYQQELNCPVLALLAEAGEWIAGASPAADALRQRLDSVVGLAEPLGRTRAALAYVVEFEHNR